MELRAFLSEKPFPSVGDWAEVLTQPVLKDPASQKRPLSARMISVVIPAHNEESYLPKTLEALQRQNYGRFEVIVVANGCTDRTREVAQDRCHRLVVLSERGLGVARNLGARMARGDILLFLDADTILEPMALRIIAAEFCEKDAAGTVQGRPDEPRLSYRIIYALKNLVHRYGLHPGSSGVIVCWREQFIRVGGFDERLEVRENSELLKRLKLFGRYKYMGAIAATTSMRRYDRCGVRRVVWLWCKLWFESVVCDLHNKRYAPVR